MRHSQPSSKSSGSWKILWLIYQFVVIIHYLPISLFIFSQSSVSCHSLVLCEELKNTCSQIKPVPLQWWYLKMAEIATTLKASNLDIKQPWLPLWMNQDLRIKTWESRYEPNGSQFQGSKCHHCIRTYWSLLDYPHSLQTHQEIKAALWPPSRQHAPPQHPHMSKALFNVGKLHRRCSLHPYVSICLCVCVCVCVCVIESSF